MVGPAGSEGWGRRPGERILGRYELISVLGAGGMGEVWKAYDHNLEREVALKRLLPHLAGDRALVERMRREGKILAGLRNRNIIAVYDMFEEADGATYLVLEFVDGISFADELETRPRLPWDRCVAVGVQVCSALGDAHGAGIIHRDIKPANILIDAAGTAHVADFGVARVAAATTAASQVLLVGTPDYWAPEQAAGKAITAATDTYSLCVVLFEAVCGRRPFVVHEDAGYEALLAMHIVQPVPDPHDLVPDLPREARDLLIRGLSKEPGQRFGSAADLSAALEASSRPRSAERTHGRVPTTVRIGGFGPKGTEPETAVPPGTGRRRLVIVGAGLTVVAVVAGVALGLVNPGGSDADAASSSVQDVEAGVVSTRLPADWAVGEAPAADATALGLEESVAAVGPGSGKRDRVVMGTSTATGPDLLPAALQPDGRQVVAAGSLVGYRYPGLRAGGRPTDTFVVPTDDGVIVVSCLASSPACDVALADVRAVGAEVLPLGPIPAVAEAVRRGVGRANSSLSRAESITGSASAAGRSAVASSVASGLRQAASAFPEPSAAGPAGGPSVARAVSALNGLAAAFDGLARAAGTDDATLWRAATRRIATQEDRLRKALAGLSAAGIVTDDS